MNPHRLGLIVPSSNTTMETELPQYFQAAERLSGERITHHGSRMRMARVTPEELARMDRESERCALELRDLEPSAVAYACLVAIMAGGPRYHVEAEARLRAALGAMGRATPVVTSAGALVRCVHRLRAKRVAILTPYVKPLTAIVARYLEECGIEVVDALGLEIDDNLAVGRIDPMDLLEHLHRLDKARADAVVLSACVQMPSLEAVPLAELMANRPVLTAAGATAFELLEHCGLPVDLPLGGALFQPRDSSAPSLRGLAQRLSA
jgi:maleate isomerase